MARPKGKNSKATTHNIGLRPKEDERFKELLEDCGLSARNVIRVLVRQWIKQGGSGIGIRQ